MYQLVTGRLLRGWVESGGHSLNDINKVIEESRVINRTVPVLPVHTSGTDSTHLPYADSHTKSIEISYDNDRSIEHNGYKSRNTQPL